MRYGCVCDLDGEYGNDIILVFVFVVCCRHSLQDLKDEFSSLREQLNVFNDSLQLFGSEHLNSLFADSCLVLRASFAKIDVVLLNNLEH